MERAAPPSPRPQRGQRGLLSSQHLHTSEDVHLILNSDLFLRRSRRQDVKHGDPLRQCRGFNAKGQATFLCFAHLKLKGFVFSAVTISLVSFGAVEKRLRETVQFGVEGSSTFLECQPRSPQATVKWLFQREGKRKLVRKKREVSRIF